MSVASFLRRLLVVAHDAVQQRVTHLAHPRVLAGVDGDDLSLHTVFQLHSLDDEVFPFRNIVGHIEIVGGLEGDFSLAGNDLVHGLEGLFLDEGAVQFLRGGRQAAREEGEKDQKFFHFVSINRPQSYKDCSENVYLCRER